jgi:hypothetical protein
LFGVSSPRGKRREKPFLLDVSRKGAAVRKQPKTTDNPASTLIARARDAIYRAEKKALAQRSRPPNFPFTSLDVVDICGTHVVPGDGP